MGQFNDKQHKIIDEFMAKSMVILEEQERRGSEIIKRDGGVIIDGGAPIELIKIQKKFYKDLRLAAAEEDVVDIGI